MHAATRLQLVWNFLFTSCINKGPSDNYHGTPKLSGGTAELWVW